MSNPLQTFRDILTDKGLIPAEIMADGKLHRCPTQTKPHKQNGAYIAHVDIPATLWWCNWENGEQGTFCTEEKQTLSVSELSAWRERQHSIERQREAEYAERHAEAAQLARQEWNSARRCDANHPYLHRKGITALESIRQARDGSLLIPVMDAANNLQSLQRIYPDGTKRFLVGGKVSGGQFIIQGQSEKPVAVCEGFATGTSIHLATGWTVYVAFSANNLARVAKTVKERFPDKTIIICGDNDEAGLRKGEDAAGLANAQLLFPHFTDDNGTDFNDLHQIEGIEAVRSQLEMALVKQHGLIALDMGEFLSMSIPERGYLLSPVLPVQGIGILYAPRGIGKTFAALSIAVAVASGGAVFNWRAPMPKRTLYVDGEMPATSMQNRLSALVNGMSVPPHTLKNMALITPDYTVRTSDVDERAIRAETPALLAQKLAAAKCRAVAESCPEDVVIGCDTVVDVDGAVFGKPADRDDARRMIRVLAGRGHLVHTGVCIAAQGRELCFAATTKVVFDALSDAEIEAYIATDDPYDKAGAYGVQNGAAKFVAGIEGCYFNVMGFPVSCVYNALKELDVL